MAPNARTATTTAMTGRRTRAPRACPAPTARGAATAATGVPGKDLRDNDNLDGGPGEEALDNAQGPRLEVVNEVMAEPDDSPRENERVGVPAPAGEVEEQ